MSKNYQLPRRGVTNEAYHKFTFDKCFRFLFTFLGITLLTILLAIVRAIVFFAFCLMTARSLHQKMFDSVLETTMRFFDLNPIGRIMNRFTKDIGNIDDDLPLQLFSFLQVHGLCI